MILRRRRREPAQDRVDDERAGETRRLEQLDQALRALSDGVIVVDEQGRTVLRNQSAERFHGARHADALAERAVSELLAAARRGEDGHRDLELFGPPKQVLRIRALSLRGPTGIVGAVAFVHDFSEVKRVESVRRDFVANVSHELKTPIGALALLAETMTGETDPEVTQQLAERVRGEAERLARIIDDLLDLSLIEAEEAPVRDAEPVSTLLREAVERIKAVADAARIPLRLTESDDLVVTCDRVQIVSAITNLLDNAVKYSEEGEPVELSAAREGESVAIVVRDHGVGIPSRDLERIFERFYRVDRARSRTTGGIGLGLAIVRHVAQAHGGDVTVQSREGEGSAFRIRLPLAPPATRDGGGHGAVREAS
jgi:two-component system, OmpR family, sensor histidine kinase SenX3